MSTSSLLCDISGNCFAGARRCCCCRRYAINKIAIFIYGRLCVCLASTIIVRRSKLEPCRCCCVAAREYLLSRVVANDTVDPTNRFALCRSFLFLTRPPLLCSFLSAAGGRIVWWARRGSLWTSRTGTNAKIKLKCLRCLPRRLRSNRTRQLKKIVRPTIHTGKWQIEERLCTSTWRVTKARATAPIKRRTYILFLSNRRSRRINGAKTLKRYYCLFATPLSSSSSLRWHVVNSVFILCVVYGCCPNRWQR